jgi:hypothetical protein
MEIFGLFLSLILTQTCLAQFKITQLKKIRFQKPFIMMVTWLKQSGGGIKQETTLLFIVMQEQLHPKTLPTTAIVMKLYMLVTTWL